MRAFGAAFRNTDHFEAKRIFVWLERKNEGVARFFAAQLKFPAKDKGAKPSVVL